MMTTVELDICHLYDDLNISTFNRLNKWGSKVDMASGVIQMLLCKTHKY